MEQKNILVVDDDVEILKNVKAFLELEGFSVDTATSGQEAIEKSLTKFYHLALLDIKLPDMEGTTLLTQLHEPLPIMMKIMITGCPSIENAVEAVNRGADAYLIKPVNPEDLLQVVRTKLQEQETLEKMTGEKIANWVQHRIEKLK